MTKYEPGVPSWVDLSARDLDGSVRFYHDLFGWETQDQGEESGHYTIARRQGRQVAGLSTLPDGSVPPHWTTYVDVDDVDETTSRVEAAGGRVLFGPADVMEAGRMAVYSDPTGAVIAAWQPGRHLGAELVNEPGAVIWNELITSDLDRARSFYAQVFGWTWSGSDEYAEIQVAGHSVGGVMPRPAEVPEDAPDYWLVYFDSDNLESDVERATSLGATTLFGPAEVPGTGRFAVLADPEGAVFALFAG
ncbi:MAG TPA: VOC family protein [Acidimicrobiales bacterium]|nr:VOC family protein [Acidimicrobiales bacterium]